ncbi:MAG: dihydroorotate dehydrogenase electron transfer subunit [Bacteroidia bacterium]|nr:dihydroorotate dehydrogenase electron transfer subunit [Bacteroidia bacterium]
MKKTIQDLKVLRNKKLTSDFFELELKAAEPLPELYPGQFVQVLIDNVRNVFLRRPFSIHDVNYQQNTFSLLIKLAGPGTRQLSYTEEGDFLNIIYPLGKPFTLDVQGDILLVGGGCGIAPLLFLARYLYDNKNIAPDILIGGKSADNLPDIDKYKAFGRVFLTTEDGSLGMCGLVSDHTLLQKECQKYSMLYACGPEPMLKIIAGIAKEKLIECEVSLENLMACGIGACLCCVVDTVDGNVCTCTEGPVFNVKRLKFS